MRLACEDHVRSALGLKGHRRPKFADGGVVEVQIRLCLGHRRNCVHGQAVEEGV